jgi:beta-lactam-binding protein with PASTA domain
MPIYEDTGGKGKSLLGAIVAGALSGLVFSILFWAIIQPLLEMSEVPDVTGKKVEIARSILEGRGFKVYQEDVVSDATVPDGAVSKQDPVPGVKARRGSMVKVWPNNAGANVPMMTGIPLAQATVLIQQAGLKLGQVIMQPSDSVAKDAIISSNPPFGSQASKDKAIDLVVSAGAGEVAVPAVRGWGRSRAQDMIKQAGLNVGGVHYVFDEEQDPGLVTRQDPQAGSKVAKGSNVNLWVTTDIEPE